MYVSQHEEIFQSQQAALDNNRTNAIRITDRNISINFRNPKDDPLELVEVIQQQNDYYSRAYGRFLPNLPSPSSKVRRADSQQVTVRQLLLDLRSTTNHADGHFLFTQVDAGMTIKGKTKQQRAIREGCTITYQESNRNEADCPKQSWRSPPKPARTYEL